MEWIRTYSPHLLGGLGALPFVTGAVFILSGGSGTDPGIIFALQIYGALILSFLGGILWGRASAADADPARRPAGLVYLVSILPVIAAWVSVPLRPDAGFGLQALSFLVFRLGEMRIAGLPAPGWFGPLRNVLTILVGLSLALMALLL